MKQPTMLIAVVLGFGVALAAVPALAQTDPAGGEYVGPPDVKCPKLEVSGGEDTEGIGRRRFSATRSADLIFHVLFDRRLGKEHVVTLKIFTPHGYLYRRLDVPLAPDKGEGRQGARRLPGYPYPVPVQALHTVTVDNRRYESVEVSFPVAGSTIVTSSLYGRWKVEVFLDGADKRCGGPTFFYLGQ